MVRLRFPSPLHCWHDDKQTPSCWYHPRSNLRRAWYVDMGHFSAPPFLFCIPLPHVQGPLPFHCKGGALTEYRSWLAWQPGYYHNVQALQSEFYSMLFYNVLKLIDSDAPTTTTTNWTNWTWGRLCRTAACPLARQRQKQCCFVYYRRFKFAVIYELFGVAKLQKWLLCGFKWLDVT